jgi:hypothetical protein
VFKHEREGHEFQRLRKNPGSYQGTGPEAVEKVRLVSGYRFSNIASSSESDAPLVRAGHWNLIFSTPSLTHAIKSLIISHRLSDRGSRAPARADSKRINPSLSAMPLTSSVTRASSPPGGKPKRPPKLAMDKEFHTMPKFCGKSANFLSSPQIFSPCTHY